MTRLERYGVRIEYSLEEQMFEKLNKGTYEENNSSESWQPCMWCDYPEDTCADLGCIWCDGNKDDIIGN